MENIILASSSPRRKEILEKYNLHPIIINSDIIEKSYSGEKPSQIAMSLSFQKSYNVSMLHQEQIVIGADTIVVYGNEILGKPKDKDDAFRILKLLNGKYHSVITGISIVQNSTNIKVVDYETTKVKFRELSHNKLKDYINTNEPMDKAGAYGIQGYGALLVEKIDGCYLNVVGLPLVKLDFLLNKFFKISLL
ncbi:MAG: septum formation inhibitor Maf [Tissierellia bacterium]|jgi:septum formation protein|nr:septum formation inhibitor Maf [Tissierellia bacterium]